MIPLFDLDYGDDERRAVDAVLAGRWLTMGDETRAFEEEFAAAVGARHAIAVSSCTAGLHLAARAVGLGPGDEAVCPALSFVATANAILYCGATPVLADVASLADWTIGPEAVARAISPRTKAIVVMHYGGQPCDMDPIVAAARERGIAVIEDAAHAPGARYQGRPVGALGDVSVFSFFSNKNLATGEGGMVCANDDALAERVRLARSHGMTSPTLDRHRGRAYTYDVVALGHNYRMDEMRAALGRVQLRKLAANNARRRERVAAYRRALGEGSPLRIPFSECRRDCLGEAWSEGARASTNRSAEADACCLSAAHIFPVLLPPGADREAFMRHMRESGAQTSMHYRPIHTFKWHSKNLPPADLPLTEEIGRREVTLPLFPSLTIEQINIIVDAAIRFFL